MRLLENSFKRGCADVAAHAIAEHVRNRGWTVQVEDGDKQERTIRISKDDLTTFVSVSVAEH